MFNLEALLSIPLSMIIFAQIIFYLKPIELRIEHQAQAVIENRISEKKNLPMYQLNTNAELADLKVNPQKVKEILSLVLDIKNSLWKEGETGGEQ